MENVNKILNHINYKNLLNELNELEKDRKYCKHNLEHFLDVARIAYIDVLEKGLGYKKEVIYSIALLHDIGRVYEYNMGIDHHEASVMIAEKILKDIDFSELDKDLILKCIKEHRKEALDELSIIIYKSDKLSRNCFNCKAYNDCYWDENKKNKIISL